MNYTLHQLRVFLQVFEHESVTRAAEALHLTQPAVSIQLKRLQDHFEIPLTEVIGRKLYITDFGNKIAEVSKRILEEAEEIKATLNQYKGLLSGKISISVVSTGKYVIPYFLNDFNKQHPQVELKVDVTNKNSVLESLAKNKTDFALVSVLPPDLNLTSIELMENRLYFVGSPNEKFREKGIAISDLNDLPLIYREKGSATRAAMESYLAKVGVSPKRTLELVSNEAVKQAVNAGLGYSIMPLIGLKNELYVESVSLYSLEGLPIKTNWNLVYHTGKNLSPAALAFITYIQNSKADVFKKHFSWTDNVSV